jgi:hypothetical protein
MKNQLLSLPYLVRRRRRLIALLPGADPLAAGWYRRDLCVLDTQIQGIVLALHAKKWNKESLNDDRSLGDIRIGKPVRLASDERRKVVQL